MTAGLSDAIVVGHVLVLVGVLYLEVMTRVDANGEVPGWVVKPVDLSANLKCVARSVIGLLDEDRNRVDVRVRPLNDDLFVSPDHHFDHGLLSGTEGIFRHLLVVVRLHVEDKLAIFLGNLDSEGSI